MIVKRDKTFSVNENGKYEKTPYKSIGSRLKLSVDSGLLGGAFIAGVPGAAIGGLVGGSKGAKVGGLIGTALVGIPLAIGMWQNTSKSSIDARNMEDRKEAEFNKDPKKVIKKTMDEQLKNLRLHKDIIPEELIKVQEITNTYLTRNFGDRKTLMFTLNNIPCVLSADRITRELKIEGGSPVIFMNGSSLGEIYWSEKMNTYGLLGKGLKGKNYSTLKEALSSYYKQNKQILPPVTSKWFEEVINKL